jgi:mannose-6-phosphate isomerase-like protein (cupin superfamily)
MEARMGAAPQLQPVNLTLLSAAVTADYHNVMLDEVNESCLRLAVLCGEYPWHCHPTSDELFIVLEGELLIDFQAQETIVLRANDMVTIPAGLVHRTRAPRRTVNLCFEHTAAATEFVEVP